MNLEIINLLILHEFAYVKQQQKEHYIYIQVERTKLQS